MDKPWIMAVSHAEFVGQTPVDGCNEDNHFHLEQPPALDAFAKGMPDGCYSANGAKLIPLGEPPMSLRQWLAFLRTLSRGMTTHKFHAFDRTETCWFFDPDTSRDLANDFRANHQHLRSRLKRAIAAEKLSIEITSEFLDAWCYMYEIIWLACKVASLDGFVQFYAK